MRSIDYYDNCTEHAQELYWNTLGKVREVEVIRSDIEYIKSENGNGPERIFKVNLDSGDVDERLNKIVADIKAGLIPDTFLISPNSKPSNIVDMLIERGFTKDTSGACMSIELSDYVIEESLNTDEFRIEKVDTDEKLIEWISIINEELFECEVLTFNQFTDLMSLDYSNFYMTYYENIPATICLTLSDRDKADITWLATRKKFRRKGLAAKTIKSALNDLKRDGIDTVSLRADSMAIKVYEKIGFFEHSRRTVMKCYYNKVYKKTCCKVDKNTVERAKEIHERFADIEEFVLAMNEEKVIGRKIWYEAESNEIFITKKYADECGGGCEGNDTLVGRRCHCGYMNDYKGILSMDYCICSAEFFRPVFEPLLGDGLSIEPVETVLSGGKECIFAIRGFK